jgi:polyisoprenoid-binding protein YceI
MKKAVIELVIGLVMILGLVACGTADPAPIDAVEADVDAQEVSEGEALKEEVEVASEEELDQPAEDVVAPEGATVFQLVEGDSEARFIIDEVLRGEPTTVIGVTSGVAGEIFINREDPSATEVGMISVDASGLKTDNNFRNGAIRDFILQTDKYPQITFTPTSMQGIPSEVGVGDTFTFEITGDLTIREITQQVTFSVDVTAESDTTIRGYGTATVLRQDFDLTIPSVPQVASVEPEVALELEFTAAK